MELNWFIYDNSGLLKAGTKDHMQFLYDLNTMELTEIAEKYKGKYERSTIKMKMSDNEFEWSGTLRLMEQKEFHKK